MPATNNKINLLLNSVPEYIQKVYCDTHTKTQPFKCAVKTCPNQFISYENASDKPFKFHNFPLDQNLNKTWKIKCGLNKSDSVKGLMVCSDHFILDDYIRNYRKEFKNPNFKRILKSNACPRKKLVESETNIIDLNYLESSETIAEQTKIATELLSAFPKEYHQIINQVEIKVGPLDINDLKQEVDYNAELTLKQMELEKELKTLKAKVHMMHVREKKAKFKTCFIENKNVTDLKALKRIFSKAQINLLMGKRAMWSREDLARAFTLRHMGTRECYLYMKNKLNIPLPSLSCLQRWASSYK